ncbi:conjugal transfer protein TraL [Pseudoalteromonas sp. SSM20]|uniref:PRK13886 family protein n=1 Tax=Pseudoalteromonas sp. SSM20 TaxID=3139394 RepID=UPI003BA9722C
MAKIHMVLQGKGGVGKSFVSALIAQYKSEKGQTPICFDTDPVNATFAGYKSLNVNPLKIMDGDEINPRNFDSLIEQIATIEQDVIIDNGAATFVPLAHYLLSNEIPELLASMGHQLIIHTVVTGGQALLDTVNGFNQLAKQFAEPSLFVVWLNPYWGAVEHEGRSFEELKAYKNNKERVSAIVPIPEFKKETFGHDLSDLLSDRLTFDEALEAEGLTIMTKQRLKLIKKQLFEVMDIAEVI